MIYLVDTIGNETGMHLYDQSFCNTLGSKGVDVRVLSNYTSADGSQRALFPNFYHGGKLLMVLKFAWSLFVFALFRCSHRKDDDIYVYQSFGLRKIDQFFIRIIGRKNLYVIVHDIFEITGREGRDPREQQKLAFYRQHVPAIICHSHDSMLTLKRLGYPGRLCYYPHFSYQFSKQIDMSHVAPEVRDAVKADKVNFLFFGQLRETKGIGILREAIRLLEQQGFDHNIIIAGLDKERLLSGQTLPRFVQPILRYIDDNELNYLFSRCQYVLLPYTEIYQSGVLEVVIYFRCPALMSDIPYFRHIADSYPSFGHLFSPNTPQALAAQIRECCSAESQSRHYFADGDIRKYQDLHDPSHLIAFLQGE